MKFASPLRYPGGKGSLAAFLTDVIDLNDLRGYPYYEPYAGGAGAALNLLRDGVVSEIHINDADRRIFAFWASALHQADRFVDRIFNVPLSMEEWRKQQDICLRPESHSDFDVGFSAFYMNRCNRSGVLTGAGPIGGYEQSGKWNLGVRFNREALSERVLSLAKQKESIKTYNLDAINFLKEKLPKGLSRARSFVYLDPPYVNKGQRLYLNAYEHKDHAEVSRYITKQKTLHWILSYDDTELVRNLYKNYNIFHLPIKYSLQQKKSAKELVIAPNHLTLPQAAKVSGTESLISRCN